MPGPKQTRWQKAVADLEQRLVLPPPPPGGGFIVLSSAQISDWDLVCLFRLAYPRTKLIAQKPLPR
jgi:hypothetical protein